MSDEQEKSQKTEQPTQKRLDDAVKKGQVPTSREVNSFFIMLSLTFFIIVMSPWLMGDLKELMSNFVTYPENFELDERSFLLLMRELMMNILILMILPAGMVIGSIIAANAVQNRFVFSAEPIKPKWNKISVIKGIGRMFSRRSLVEFLKGILKICIVGAVALIAIWPFKDAMGILPDEDIFDLLAFIMSVTARMMIGICCILGLIAFLDYTYQKYEYIQNLKMTRQEVRDEYKQQEGDPMVKQRLRQIRRERARQSMMEAVPKADVIITNPTHYAVALKYDSLTMSAPVVLAKGVDKVAHRIRERAEAHKIAIVRNPALTRLLYDNAEINEEIPFEYYKAVAEVIGYVYKLKGINLRDKP